VAGNVAVLFIGWEFVGLSSALLVAFFHERPAPVSNALRVFSVYRISDAAMLSAAVWLRHVVGSDSLSLLFGGARGAATPNLAGASGDDHRHPPHRGRGRQERAAAVLELAAARDGGADAIERGLLRIVVDSRRLLPAAARGATARTGTGSPPPRGSRRSDDGDLWGDCDTRAERREVVAGVCALTQVGLIVVEIAAGWYTLAFLHLAGHACFRLLQFLTGTQRPARFARDGTGARNDPIGPHPAACVSDRARTRVPRQFLDRLVVDPFTRWRSSSRVSIGGCAMS
jgi:NAD(P)H-quinone oxidoreductase subunit 5